MVGRAVPNSYAATWSVSTFQKAVTIVEMSESLGIIVRRVASVKILSNGSTGFN